MKNFNTLARCLSLLLAALMLSGMLAVAEPAAVETEPAEENPFYDIIYSSSNPIPEIAANVRPSMIGNAV